MHGVVKFDPLTGKQFKGRDKSYTQTFAEGLIAEAKADDRIIAVHAAMGGGTGLNIFEKHFPDRTFDVGIAEQHAVTFAAGLACEGLVPVCAIYSTFLQRCVTGHCPALPLCTALSYLPRFLTAPSTVTA